METITASVRKAIPLKYKKLKPSIWDGIETQVEIQDVIEHQRPFWLVLY